MKKTVMAALALGSTVLGAGGALAATENCRLSETCTPAGRGSGRSATPESDKLTRVDELTQAESKQEVAEMIELLDEMDSLLSADAKTAQASSM